MHGVAFSMLTRRSRGGEGKGRAYLMVGVVIWQVDGGGWRAVLVEGGMGVAAAGEQRAVRQRPRRHVESAAARVRRRRAMTRWRI